MTTLSFVRSHDASYGHVIDERELNVQVHEGDSFLYEFMVKERVFENGASFLRPTPPKKFLQVCIFDDSWRAFTDHPEFFELVASFHAVDVTLEDLVSALTAAGFKDRTDEV